MFCRRFAVAAVMAVSLVSAGRSAAADKTGGQAKSGYPQVLLEVLSPPQGNKARWQRYAGLLEQAGAVRRELVVTRVRTCGKDESNVVTTLPGTSQASGIIVIAAHTDSTGRGQGAVDNWSGSVMLAALYGYFRKTPHRHTLMFAAFSGEEHGCDGSRQFVRDMKRATGRRIRAMINLECLCVGRLRVWSNRSSDGLEQLCRKAADRVGVPVFSQVLFGYHADAESFSRKGIPAITIHSLSPEKLSYINGARDTTDLVNLWRYQQAYRLLTAFVCLVDGYEGEISSGNRQQAYHPVARTLYKGSRDTRAHVGVEVVNLPKGSPEAMAGIRRGDIVTQVADIMIHSRMELLPVLLTLRRNTRVRMRLQRVVDGKNKVVEVEVRY